MKFFGLSKVIYVNDVDDNVGKFGLFKKMNVERAVAIHDQAPNFGKLVPFLEDIEGTVYIRFSHSVLSMVFENETDVARYVLEFT